MSEFLTMKEIGKALGVTSHVVGRKLKELGLRTPGGKPSSAAFRGGYVDQHWSPDRANYCWAWERTKTLAALEKTGLTCLTGH